MGQNQFFYAACDATGQQPICFDAKLMLVLKQTASTLAWQNYFQIASTTSRTVVEELCFMVSTNEML